MIPTATRRTSTKSYSTNLYASNLNKKINHKKKPNLAVILNVIFFFTILYILLRNKKDTAPIKYQREGTIYNDISYNDIIDDEDVLDQRDIEVEKKEDLLLDAADKAKILTENDNEEQMYCNYAVAVKTGKDTVLQRAPIGLLTFLKDIKNVLFIGETGNVTLGDTVVEDVCSDLYDNLPKPLYWEETMSTLKQKKESFQNINSPPGEKNLGWKLDAHKNLPGFVKLYTKFPNAKWYIMIDDDTYLFMSNLDAVLDQFNSEEEHYFGSDTMFKGCDGVTKFGDGPKFAHGGSGVILSNAAIKKMVENSDNCIVKYRDCWAGDVRAALCLRDVGIMLQPMNNLNKGPPDSSFWYPTDPCQRPITFHNLITSQIQRLYLISKRAENLPNEKKKSTVEENKLIDTADVQDDEIIQRENQEVENDKNFELFGSFFFPNLFTSALNYGDVFQEFSVDYDLKNFEVDKNRPGSDYKSENSFDAVECKNKCKEEPKCLSWTFDDGRCWMKNSIPMGYEKVGVVSGVFPEKYVCKKKTKNFF
ncbi:hypothetical protein HDU92_002323 [Lobulomyces angularis]|nr:hypothetical protein HDU92_002323 [Lobulomyces angularis]